MSRGSIRAWSPCGMAAVMLVSAVLPAAGAEDPKTEIGLLFGGMVAGHAATGMPETFGEARPAFGIRGARLLTEFLTVFADATFSGFDTADAPIDVRMVSIRTGPELLLPWIGDKTRFFLAGAVGWMDAGYTYHSGAPPPDERPRDWNRTFASVGIGQRVYVGDQDMIRWEIRAENTLSHQGLGNRDLTNYQALIGYSWGRGGKPVDVDGDGVPDRRDECPDSPLGAVVDLKGCPLDSDNDGVFDGIDQCPDTPQGYPVDARGCPLDSDGDGVPDGADACPGTQKGAMVDARGCPQDSDGDGVPDGIDRCPDTPKGAKVNGQGCPLDSDGDGVFDGIDRCPDTPRGTQVDATGCPIVTAPAPFGPEQPLVVVNFDSDKADLLPAAVAILDRLAESLQAWPDVNAALDGHADSTNTQAHNQALSQRRADAVLKYLVSKGIDASRVKANAFGETKPTADNATPAGRATNRRVEISKAN